MNPLPFGLLFPLATPAWNRCVSVPTVLPTNVGSTVEKAPTNPPEPTHLFTQKYLAIESRTSRASLQKRGLYLAIFICCLVTSFSLSGQSLTELEQKRREILAEIQVTNQLLEETTSNKDAALQRYVTLQSQIKKRRSLIQNLQKEVEVFGYRIQRTEEVVEALTADIAYLKTEYGKMLQQLYREKITRSTLLYILSADSFNKMLKRWQYVRQYDAYRQKQASLILDTQKTLSQKIDLLQERKKQKETLLQEQQSQTTTLRKEMDDRNSLYKLLKKDEKRLQKDLERFLAARERLDQAISDIIFAHQSASKPADTPRVAPPTTTKNEVTAADMVQWTQAFQAKRGNLPKPVQSGVITGHFGEQAHPSIPHIKINNNGIDIKTTPQAEAYAVFDGVVAGTQFIPGYQYTVIVKHGEYFSVYSNLEELFIKKDMRVSQGEALGKVSTDRKSGATELHFEVWRQKKRLNPTDWIRK